MKAPEPRNLVVQAMVPVLSQVIGHAQDKNSPEEWHPVEEIVLAWRNKGEHLQAKPGKEWSKNQLGKSEADQVKHCLIAPPFVSIASKRELRQTEGDDEHDESIAAQKIAKGPEQSRAINGHCGMAPETFALKRQRRRHQQKR
jgi:hypothetical protein